MSNLCVVHTGICSLFSVKQLTVTSKTTFSKNIIEDIPFDNGEMRLVNSFLYTKEKNITKDECNQRISLLQIASSHFIHSIFEQNTLSLNKNMNNDNEIVIEENTGNDILKNIEVCDNCNVERIIIHSNCYNKVKMVTIANNENLREIVMDGKDCFSLGEVVYLIMKSK